MGRWGFSRKRKERKWGSSRGHESGDKVTGAQNLTQLHFFFLHLPG